jgi:hypothetical protein
MQTYSGCGDCLSTLAYRPFAVGGKCVLLVSRRGASLL